MNDNGKVKISWTNSHPMTGVEIAFNSKISSESWEDDWQSANRDGFGGDTIETTSIENGRHVMQLNRKHTNVIGYETKKFEFKILNLKNYSFCPENATSDCIWKDSIKVFYLNSTIDDCQTPDAPLNGSVTVHFNATHHIAYYSCLPGQKLNESDANLCPIDGDWTRPSTPRCDMISCGVGAIPKQMRLTESDVVFANETMDILCPNGDVEEIRCDGNGHLANFGALCKRSWFENVAIWSLSGVIVLLLIALLCGLLKWCAVRHEKKPNSCPQCNYVDPIYIRN